MKFELSNAKIIKLIPPALGVIILIFIFWSNFSPLGHQVIEYNFARSNPFTYGLTPSTRVEPIVCTSAGCSQEIFGDPTYIDLLLPRHFDTLTAEITYENNGLPISLGVKTASGWNYIISPLDTIHAGKTVIGKATLNLNKAYVEKRKINLMLSIPKLKDGAATLKIYNIKFTLDRESFLRKIIRKIKAI